MRRLLEIAGLALLSALAAAPAAWAQPPLHDNQYAEADIAYGAKVYVARCMTCHGTQGDAIGGVDLRSGRFRNAVIDRDLERFIRAGSPAGMPAFALDSAEMAGIIAYLRNMNAVDAASVATGDAARGPGGVGLGRAVGARVPLTPRGNTPCCRRSRPVYSDR